MVFSGAFYSKKEQKKNVFVKQNAQRKETTFAQRVSKAIWRGFFFKLILLQFNRRTIFCSFVGNRILSVQYRIHLFSCNYFVCLRTLFPLLLLVQPTWLLYTWNMTRIYALANNSTSQCVPFYHFKRWPYNALRMQLMAISFFLSFFRLFFLLFLFVLRSFFCTSLLLRWLVWSRSVFCYVLFWIDIDVIAFLSTKFGSFCWIEIVHFPKT